MAIEAHGYSTLEAVQTRSHTYQPGCPLMPDAGMQVVPDNDKQLVIGNEGLEPVVKEGTSEQENGDSHVLKPTFLHRRYLKRGATIALVVIIILIAVLGGYFGSRKTGDSATTAASLLPSTSSATTSLTAASPTSSAPINPFQRNVAAISYVSNSTNHTRIYYQDAHGELTESINTGYDVNKSTGSGSISWGSHGTGAFPMNESVIAAAVSRPNFPLEISLFYVDSHYLINDIQLDFSSGSWSAGTIGSRGYTIHPNSSLSAMYNQCRLCANTKLVAFQDENGFVQIANFTADGWKLTQLSLDPFLGTGLALQPFYRLGLEDQINLYYQNEDLNMTLASWVPAQLNNGVYGWVVGEQIYYTAAPGTPIAAASSYTNVSTGFETWIEVLSLSSRGIEVDTWSGAINDWLEHGIHPSALSNSTANQKTYKSIAVTAIGSAFAVVGQDGKNDVIEWSQVADDMVDWTLLETMDTWS